MEFTENTDIIFFDSIKLKQLRNLPRTLQYLVIDTLQLGNSNSFNDFNVPCTLKTLYIGMIEQYNDFEYMFDIIDFEGNLRKEYTVMDDFTRITEDKMEKITRYYEEIKRKIPYDCKLKYITDEHKFIKNPRLEYNMLEGISREEFKKLKIEMYSEYLDRLNIISGRIENLNTLYFRFFDSDEEKNILYS